MSKKLQDNEGTTADQDQLEVDNVLARYLELYSFDCNMFKYYIAPNGVVDWFGRTIRGHGKIHEYLRTEVCTAYEHLYFNKSRRCDPIEIKPAHMKTKEMPTETYLPTETTKLGKLQTSLKLLADSDVEDNGDMEKKEDIMLDISPLSPPPPPTLAPKKKTPEKMHINEGSKTVAESTRRRDVISSVPNATNDDSGNSDSDPGCLPSKPKRLKRSLGTVKVAGLPNNIRSDIRINRRCSAVRKKVDVTICVADNNSSCTSSVSASEGAALLDSSLSDDDRDEQDWGNSKRYQSTSKGGCQADGSYSQLKYIETTGTLRSCVQPKHRGVGGSRLSSATASTTSAACHYNDESPGSWDRKTRIKISYRVRLRDNQIQFALIIYDHLVQKQKPSRRNLIMEFNQLADEQDDDASSVEADREDKKLSRSVDSSNSSNDVGDNGSAIAGAERLINSRTPPPTPSKKPKLHNSLTVDKVNATTIPQSVKQKPARSLRLF